MIQIVRAYILTLVLVVLGTQLQGQKTFQPKETKYEVKGILYRKSTAFEFRLHTNGFLIGYNTGKIRIYNKQNYYHLSLGCLGDPRERSQNKNRSISINNRSRSFKFGKRNTVFNVRAGVGTKKYLSEKAKRRGIAVGYDFNVGPSLALLKPYYLELQYVRNAEGVLTDEIRTEKYSDENASFFTDFESIYGGASFWEGFDEIRVVPGIQMKAGLFFSLGAHDATVKSIEVGIMGDVYITNIPIMVSTESVSNKPYFFNVYVAMHFGWRSN